MITDAFIWEIFYSTALSKNPQSRYQVGKHADALVRNLLESVKNTPKIPATWDNDQRLGLHSASCVGPESWPGSHRRESESNPGKAGAFPRYPYPQTWQLSVAVPGQQRIENYQYFNGDGSHADWKHLWYDVHTRKESQHQVRLSAANVTPQCKNRKHVRLS